ncbi:uncharacterized protein LOC132602067 [Lycium barbarum]|uniref:uncharacterized protein LOC132602067 n=1 Tax=Lycium barbarum TaxID=112863 RepID=UPI00293F383D|nr:uncharacterized protein LOC132602067 [Lycium barbarum]
MKTLVLVSWLCLIIFLKTLPYASCTSIPKSTVHELILKNENKGKFANDTLLESTSTKSNKDEHKDVHKIVHHKKGAYGGADLLRKGHKKNGANNNNFERPILVSSLLFSLHVAFTI